MRSEEFMLQALRLANRALGRTSPNPAVGAVIVKNGEIIGRGYTQPPGGDHAEVVALKEAGEKARGAVMYVTLEPCCHIHKRTPPCTKAIISSAISEIHIATLDPNPDVSGKGVREIEEAGIKVVLGECEERARELNEAYFKFITTGLPWVSAKFALSLDGKLSTHTGESKWISGEKARRMAHRLRFIHDAIIVGINTVLRDDPRLTVRDSKDRVIKTPLRVVVDSLARLPTSSRLLREPGKVLVAVAEEGENAQKLKMLGAEIVKLNDGHGKVDLKGLLKLLGERGIASALVEGGGKLLGSFFDLNLVDKVYAFFSPIIIGGERATIISGEGISQLKDALKLERLKIRRVGKDILVAGYLSRKSQLSIP